jgi:hypothetical protein
MGSDSGKPYSILSGAPFHNPPFPKNFLSSQTIMEGFEQIDVLGLGWFENRAIEMYQNKTGAMPEINGLGVDVSFGNQSNYQGMNLLLLGFSLSNDNSGNKISNTIYRAEFQPNGTLLSFT